MSQLFIAHGHRDIDPLLQVHEAMRRASIPTWYTPAGSKDSDPDSVNDANDNAFGMLVLVSADIVNRDNYILLLILGIKVILHKKNVPITLVSIFSQKPALLSLLLSTVQWLSKPSLIYHWIMVGLLS